MTFQLVVDSRVAQKADSFEDAVREADICSRHHPRSRIEIVNLAGGFYGDAQVARFVEVWRQDGGGAGI